MKSSLYTCIQDIQNGDREQALALLEKFLKILKVNSTVRLCGGINSCISRV